MDSAGDSKSLFASVGDEDPKILMRRRVSSAKRRPLTRSGHCWLETHFFDTHTVDFEALWALKPSRRCRVMMHDGPTEVHRWQKTLGQVPEFQRGSRHSYMFGVPGEDELGGDIPEPWASMVQEIGRVTHSSPNQATVNWYEGPSDFIAFHSDYTGGLEGPVAILSLYPDVTESRDLVIKARAECDNALAPQLSVSMPHGSVVTMGGHTQEHFMHSVRKCPRGGRRISVTARHYHPERT